MTYSVPLLNPLSVSDSVADLVDFSDREQQRFGMGWSIDGIIGEMGLGEMALMWARSSAGKSTWVLNVVNNTPYVPTVVVSMEMTPRRQVEWLAAMANDLSFPAKDIDRILRDRHDSRRRELIEALDSMQQTFPHLHFVMPSAPTVADIEVLVQDIADSTGVKPLRVFIDHLGLMKNTADYTNFVYRAGQLHDLALRQNLAVVVLQQVKRGGGGDEGRDDGHLPITLSSGVFAGEADADWVFGLSRPERDPKFRWPPQRFKKYEEYLAVRARHKAVKGKVILQCIKNRIFSELCEDGVELTFNPYSRRYEEW